MTNPHKMLRVKPARNGEIVRIPERKMRPLAPEGEFVPGNNYWHRRLALGDVIDLDDPKNHPEKDELNPIDAKEPSPVDAPPSKVPEKQVVEDGAAKA